MWKVTYQREVYMFPEIKLADVVLKYNVKITCLISVLHLWQECCQKSCVRSALFECVSLQLVTEINSDVLYNVGFLSFTFDF